MSLITDLLIAAVAASSCYYLSEHHNKKGGQRINRAIHFHPIPIPSAPLNSRAKCLSAVPAPTQILSLDDGQQWHLYLAESIRIVVASSPAHCI